MLRTKKGFRDIAQYDMVPAVETRPFERFAYSNYEDFGSALRAYSSNDQKTTASSILVELRPLANCQYMSANDKNVCAAMIAFFETVEKQDKAIAAVQRAIAAAKKVGVSQATLNLAVEDLARAA